MKISKIKETTIKTNSMYDLIRESDDDDDYDDDGKKKTAKKLASNSNLNNKANTPTSSPKSNGVKTAPTSGSNSPMSPSSTGTSPPIPTQKTKNSGDAWSISQNTAHLPILIGASRYPPAQS